MNYLYEKIVDNLPLPEKLKTFLHKSRQLVMYLFIGVLTTLLNGLAYYLCTRIQISNVPATVIAWIIAVFFAFWANKWIVFSSNTWTLKQILTEMAQFFGCRAGTGVFDVGIMYLTVSCWGWNGLLMKLVSDFIVTLVNFVASKFYIFANKEKEERS